MSEEGSPLHSSVGFIQKTSAGGNGPRFAPLPPRAGNRAMGYTAGGPWFFIKKTSGGHRG